MLHSYPGSASDVATPAFNDRPENQEGLTKNQGKILTRLSGLGRAATAYEILELVRPDGISVPTSIYRSLKELETMGLVRQVTTTKSFVAVEPGQQIAGTETLLVCENCHRVSAATSKGLEAAVKAVTTSRGFVARSACIEVPGRCKHCPPA